jgi:hypothetical protein
MDHAEPAMRVERSRPVGRAKVTSLRTAHREMTRRLLLSKSLELFAAG